MKPVGHLKPFAFLFLLFLVFTHSSISWAADEASLGETAEKGGKSREALTHYVAALQFVTEGNADDQRLREKIIAIVQKLNPPPAIPEEAERRMGRGTAAFKVAESPDDFKLAAEEFKKASDVAPWWPEAYFNLGLVKEQQKEYEKAIFDLKLYLLAAPQGPDAKSVKQKIYEMEFLADREKTKSSEAQGQKAKLQSLLGDWKLEIQLDQLHQYGTFTIMTMKDETTVEGYATVTSFQNTGYPVNYVSELHSQLTLRGTLKGESIQWEAWVDPIYPECKSWQGFKQITLSISGDQRRISFQNPVVAFYPSPRNECADQLWDYVLTRS